jgi:uncharacterized protein (TIGR02284 family)
MKKQFTNRPCLEIYRIIRRAKEKTSLLLKCQSALLRCRKFIFFLCIAFIFLFITGCSFVPVSKEAITKSDQNERTVSVLNNLIQVDIDTYHTYTQAIQASNSEYTQTLIAFRDEYKRQIVTLSKIVIARGGVPPEFSRDFKGYMTSGYTAVKVKGGLHSIFQAMETNETLSCKYHEDTLKVDLPGDIREAIQVHLRAGKTHLHSIKRIKQQLAY